MTQGFSFMCKAGALLATLRLVTACEVETGDDDGNESTGDTGGSDGGDVVDTSSDETPTGDGGDDTDGDGGVPDVGPDVGDGDGCVSVCPEHIVEQLDCEAGTRCVEYPYAPVCEACP